MSDALPLDDDVRHRVVHLQVERRLGARSLALYTQAFAVLTARDQCIDEPLCGCGL